jgi:hypothetical protein
MKRQMLMALFGVLGLLGMAAPAMAHEHERDGFRRAPVVEWHRNERRERDRFERRFERRGRFGWDRY